MFKKKGAPTSPSKILKYIRELGCFGPTCDFRRVNKRDPITGFYDVKHTEVSKDVSARRTNVFCFPTVVPPSSHSRTPRNLHGNIVNHPLGFRSVRYVEYPPRTTSDVS